MDVLDSAEMFREEAPPAPTKPNTFMVLALLVVAAATFSYLGAFAVTRALADANVIRAIPKDPDPRPLWAVISFAGLLAGFVLTALVMRYLSWRQFRRIDRIAEEA